MGEWQPIDTAPKDGTLVIIGTAFKDRPGRVFYDWFYEDDQWGDEDTSAYDILFRGEEITHWMPEIEPPNVKVDK